LFKEYIKINSKQINYFLSCPLQQMALAYINWCKGGKINHKSLSSSDKVITVVRILKKTISGMSERTFPRSAN